ncbi:hypothetical protein GGI42DRAFT_17199 [Trichoderma sp. SZMC 28013]
MSEYLQPDIDPSALGFLSIFLGGSIIHKTNLAEASIRDVDWDGVGFVPRKTDIISLLRERRADLCDLLGVVEEDGSTASWEEALELAATLDWQVLRFSGWTRSGSKRTLKIWSQEHLAAAVSYPGSSYLGVLSHKTLHTIQLNQGALGPGILVCPPVQVTDNVYIMSDFDLIQIAVPADQSSEIGAWPGVLCDLLLTSRCMFESSRGLGASLKQLIWSKWGDMLHQNDTASTLGPAPFSLYRWASFGKAFKDGLLLEGATTRPLTAASPSSLPAGKLRTTFLTIRPDQGDSMTTSSVGFVSYDKPEWNLQPALHSSFASIKVDTSTAPTPPHTQFVITDKSLWEVDRVTRSLSKLQRVSPSSWMLLRCSGGSIERATCNASLQSIVRKSGYTMSTSTENRSWTYALAILREHRCQNKKTGLGLSTIVGS